MDSPVSTHEIRSIGSNESKKRKSISESEPIEPRRISEVPLERNTSSPLTSESSVTGTGTLEDRKDVRIQLPERDSDGVTEEEAETNTTKDTTSHLSSMVGSPIPKADDGSVRSEHSSHKKPRFDDSLQSPLLLRQRSYTFSTASEYQQQAPIFSQNPLDALSWLATIAEKEVDAAKSLFEMSHDTSQELEDRGIDGYQRDRRVRDNSMLEEEDEEEEEEEGGDRFEDPYLVAPSALQTSALLSSTNNDSEVSDSEFAAVSYLQRFQQKAKEWKDNPFEGRPVPPSSSSSAAVIGTEGVDPLELLTNSADLVASPMTRRKLFSDQQQQSQLSPLPTRQTRSFHRFTTAFEPNQSLALPHQPDYHYLDTMTIELETVAHTKPYQSGRGRSASMSLLEGSSLGVGTLEPFDNPALARFKESFGKKSGLPVTPKGEGYIGIYSPEERKMRIQRFLEKRKHRMWAKKVKYDVRKNFADSRIRVKGRFVKKEEEKAVMIQMLNK